MRQRRIIGYSRKGRPVYEIAGAAGIAQTVIRAQEATQNVPSSRAIRDMAQGIKYLDPDSAPLTVIMMNARTVKPATNWKYEWMEKELPARWDAINGGNLLSGSTSLTVDNAKFFSVGDVVNIVRTGEKMIVSGSGDSFVANITVVRGVGSTAAAALLDNDDLQIIGNAYPEGSTAGTPKSVAETYQFNYTQIMRTPFGETRTEANTDNYTGKGRVVLRYEKGVEHRIDLERTALFGERAESHAGNDSTDNPRRYTGGILYFLTGLSTTAKIKDFNGTVSDPEISDWLQDVFQATGGGGKSSRTLVASPLWVSIFDNLSLGRMQTRVGDDTYGVTIRQYLSSHGTLNIVKHRLLENSPVPAGTVGGPFGYAGHALALDFSEIRYRPLQNSTTKLQTDIQANDYDGWKDEYITECGWEIGLAKVHGVGKNASG